MTTITLVKNSDGDFGPRLLDALEGINEEHQSLWWKFRNAINAMGSGEIITFEWRRPRNPRFHRLFFAMLNIGFEHWNPGRKHKTHNGLPVEKSFEVFREEVTIAAGYYVQVFNLAGEFRLKAKSIAFGSMDQDEFEKLFNAVANVLLEHVLVNYSKNALLDEVDRAANEIVRMAA